MKIFGYNIMGLVKKEVKTGIVNEVDVNKLSKNELEILLLVLKNSIIQIPGSQIQTLHDLVWKIQQQYEQIK